MKQMSYDEFKEELLKMVRARLGNTVKVEIARIKKNNKNEKDTLGIKDNDQGLKPLIHVDGLYEQFCAGTSLSGCVGFVTTLYSLMPSFHMEHYFKTWEEAKERIELRIINRIWNEEELKGLPHKEYLDLAVYCRLVLEKNQEGIVSAAVENSMLRYWNITEETLWDAAEKNFQKEKFVIRPINEAIGLPKAYLEKLIRCPEKEDETCVLTNGYRNRGAVGMLRVDLLKEFAEKKGCNLYILPSSLNEVILLPDRNDRSPEDLRSYVRRNNRAYPDEGDLSDNIYYFRREKGKIEIIL